MNSRIGFRVIRWSSRKHRKQCHVCKDLFLSHRSGKVIHTDNSKYLILWYSALTSTWSRSSTSRPEQRTTLSEYYLRLSADTADNDDDAWLQQSTLFAGDLPGLSSQWSATMTVRHWPTTLLRQSIPKRSVLIWAPIYMENLEKIWGSFLVATKLEFGLTFPRKSAVVVAWLLHHCIDQQPGNLWTQDVWGRRFERATPPHWLLNVSNSTASSVLLKMRFPISPMHLPRRPTIETGSFSFLTVDLIDPVHDRFRFDRCAFEGKVWRDLRGSSGLRWFPGYTRFVLRRSRSCLQWCGKFSFSTISMSVHAESPESSASLLLPVLSVRAMWVVLLRTVMFMCS